MSVRNLEHLFRPQSVAIIGASGRERSVGAIVLRNLIKGGFTGPIFPVNPKYTDLEPFPRSSANSARAVRRLRS
jgi:acetyltransferase